MHTKTRTAAEFLVAQSAREEAAKRRLKEAVRLTRRRQAVAEAEEAGRRVAEGVSMFIQFGSEGVQRYARERGYLELFERAGVTVINPGCGACIGCGPGVSDAASQVTVSAINRNFQGRSGPGKLYLASPLTVAASAVEGRIVSYQPGMFRAPVTAENPS